MKQEKTEYRARFELFGKNTYLCIEKTTKSMSSIDIQVLKVQLYTKTI